MTAPERIWAAEIGTATKGGQAFRIGRWITDESASHPDEYVRRDPTVIASLPEVQALVKAEREQCARIIAAGSALIARWDSQDWKSGHTLDFITQLREAIRAGTEGGE